MLLMLCSFHALREKNNHNRVTVLSSIAAIKELIYQYDGTICLLSKPKSRHTSRRKKKKKKLHTYTHQMNLFCHNRIYETPRNDSKTHAETDAAFVFCRARLGENFKSHFTISPRIQRARSGSRNSIQQQAPGSLYVLCKQFSLLFSLKWQYIRRESSTEKMINWVQFITTCPWMHVCVRFKPRVCMHIEGIDAHDRL